MTNLQELQARLEAKRKENAERISNLLDAKKIEVELARMDSKYFEKQALRQRDIDNLNSIISLIEEKQSKHNKKLQRTFGYGEINDLIITICTNTLYSKMEDREELLIATGLTTDLIENLLESLGRSAWYNPKINAIVDEVDYDIQKLQQYLDYSYLAIGLVSEPDQSKINKEALDKRFTIARLSAEELMANSIKYECEEVVEYN